MNGINIQNKKLIGNYQPSPDLYYDIEGRVKSSNGKELTLEKEVGNQVVEYTLNLKEEKKLQEGDEVKIDKEEINSVRSKTIEKVSPEDIEDIGRILRTLGLSETPSNIQLVNKIIRMGIEPTKVNVDNYIRSMEDLSRIESSLDLDSLVKVLDEGVEINDLSLNELANKLEGEKEPKKPIFSLSKKLGYRDAEKIAVDIYGQKMGKDIYDIIISLDESKIEITRENIDQVMDVLYKISDIKDLELEDYIKAIDLDIDFNVTNLYRIKNNYIKSSLAKHRKASDLEKLTVTRETNLSSLKELLANLSIEIDKDNIRLAREFIINDLAIVKEDLYRVREMEEDIETLVALIESMPVGEILSKKTEILGEDIKILLDRLTGDSGLGTEDIEVLENITSSDLVKLLKTGGEFNLKNLGEIIRSGEVSSNEIEYEVVDKAVEISDILSKIDSLKFSEINLKEDMSLGDIYRMGEIGLEAKDLTPHREKERQFIINEYIRFKENIGSKAIRISIEESLDLVEVPLKSANNFIETRVNRYREISGLMEEFNSIYNHKEILLPLIIKNGLDMTYGKLENLRNFLIGDGSLSSLIAKEKNEEYNRLKKEITDLVLGGEDIRAGQEELLNLMSQGDFTGGRDRDEYFEIQEELNKDGLVLQIPLDLDGFKDLNMYIADLDRVKSKTYMDFSLSLETSSLGEIRLGLEVKGRDIYLDIGGAEKLRDYIYILEDKLGAKGYNLSVR